MPHIDGCGIVIGVGEQRILAGRYRLEDAIGRGGMSEVWRAFDLVLTRQVAVKLLAGVYSDNDQFREAIRIEAQTAAKVSHPHLASVYDYGEALDGAGQPVPYVVMELLTGPTLTQRLADGPLPPHKAMRICAEIAEGLAVAHAHGLVHRDVKPSNIVLTGAGAKLVDFGVATTAGAPEISSPGGDIMGTPSYVAPERLLGGTALPASDVYSLGAVLFRAITGELPWPVGMPTVSTRTHPAALPDLDGLAPQIAELYRRCVDLDPDRRPTAREVATVLAAGAGIRPILADDIDDEATDGSPVVPGRPIAATPSIDDEAETTGTRLRRRHAAPIFMAVTAVAVAGIIAVGNINRPRGGPPQAEAQPGVPTVVGPDATHPNSNPPPVNPGATAGAPPGGAAAGTGLPPAMPGPGGVPDGVPGGVGGSTTSSPPAAGTSQPPPTTDEPGSRTFTSPGGSAVATCNGSLAFIESWSPAPGYSIPQPPRRGPDTTVWITFRNQNSDATITMWCSDGQPEGQVSTVHTTRTPRRSTSPARARATAHGAPADRGQGRGPTGRRATQPSA